MKQVPTLAVDDRIEELARINSDPDAGGITREVFTADYMRASSPARSWMRCATATGSRWPRRW